MPSKVIYHKLATSAGSYYHHITQGTASKLYRASTLLYQPHPPAGQLITASRRAYGGLSFTYRANTHQHPLGVLVWLGGVSYRFQRVAPHKLKGHLLQRMQGTAQGPFLEFFELEGTRYKQEIFLIEEDINNGAITNTLHSILKKLENKEKARI